MSELLVEPLLLKDAGYKKPEYRLQSSRHIPHAQSIFPGGKIKRYMPSQDRIILREMLVYPDNTQDRLLSQLVGYKVTCNTIEEKLHLSSVISKINKHIKVFGRIKQRYNGNVTLTRY